jgi:hypothetical protein
MKLKNRILSIFAVFAFCVAATSAWAGQSTLNSDGARVRMPQSGTDTLTIGSGVHSFEISRCSEECDDAVLVLKAPTGLRIQLGPLFGELLNNPLQAYDGADINAPLLFSRTVDAQFPGVSVDAPYGRYVSSGEYMKVVYKKGESDFFTLNAIVVNPNETHSVALCSNVDYNDDHCTSGSNNGGTVSSAVNSATVNTQVSLNATPNTGKLLNRVHAWDKFGSIAVTGGTWYTSNDATFTMPATSVWFEAFYATALTAEGGLTIEKPKNEVLEVNIPDNVESFTVNGWVDLSCSSMAPGKPLILRAPEGKHLQVLDSDGKPHDRGVFYRGQSVPYDGVYDDPVAAGAATLVGSVSYSNVLTLIDYLASASDDVRTIVRLMDESEVNNTPHSVTVINKGKCSGSVSSGVLNLGSVVVGTPVSMTVNPDEGCALNDVYVTIRSEEDTARVPMTGGSWFAGNDFSFTMPFEDVYVVVNYAEKTNFTVSNDIHIDMPERGTLSASIPDYVSSFYINDPKMQYDGVLVLTAPEDYKILLYGYADDYEGTLDIYDGPSTGATLLSSPRRKWVEVESSGNTMTLYLKGRPVFGNLTVELIPVQKYEIHIQDVANGTVVSSHSTAKAGDIVTLSYTPSNGYLLRSVNVWYNGTYFDVTGGKWYNNEAQFTMPASDVYVSSEFCYTYNCDLEIVMPQTGTENANIPKNIEFYIYSMDNGDDAYSNNSDGTLTLTAPEGYVFNFGGWIQLNDAGDYLEIYDGANVNANKLLTASFVDNDWQELDEMYSSSRYLTLRFKSNETGIGEGLELYAKAVKLPDLALEIPRSSSSSVVLDNDVSYIQIQNEKDANGYYFNNSDGSISLTAPEGYGLSVIVTMFNIDNGIPCPDDIQDSLFVLNGTDVNSTLLATISNGQYYFGGIYSIGRSLTFRFKSGECLSGSGVALDVNVVKNEGSSAVAIYEDENWGKLAFVDGSYGGENQTEAVNIPSGITVNNVEFTRSFPVDVYSTVVLPFSVNTAHVDGLKAVLYYNGIRVEDDKSSPNYGKSYIRMKVLWAEDGYIKDENGKDVSYSHTNMAANIPYMLLMSEPTFAINAAAYPLTLAKTESAETSIDGWTFRGTWKYKKWGAKNVDPETGNAYGFSASESGSGDSKINVGDFVRVGEGAWIRPMRAYLVKAGINNTDGTAQRVRANGAYVKRPALVQEELPELMSIVIDDEEGNGKQTTVIGQFNTRTGEFKMIPQNRTFDVKGRNVGKENKAHGAYYGK